MNSVHTVRWFLVLSATMFCKSLLLQCCLLKFVLSIPTNNFFPNGQVASDTNVTSTETPVSVFTDIGLDCGVVRLLKVSIFLILLSGTLIFVRFLLQEKHLYLLLVNPLL